MFSIEFQEDATGFDLTNQLTSFGGTGAGAPDGGDGTIVNEQVIAMLLPTDSEVPIKRVAVESEEPVRLASLNGSLIAIRHSLNSTDEFRDPVSSLKQLIADVQYRVPSAKHPQRRIFSYQSKIRNQKSKMNGNRYLTLASAKADTFPPFARE